MSEATTPRSIIALDLIRGIAAFDVMISNVRDSNWVDFASLPASQKTAATAIFFLFTRLGHESVLIFFILSGFLVGGSLIERLKARRFNIRDYAIDRTTRILIPLAPACILTAMINVLGFGQPLVFSQLIGNALGLNGIIVNALANNGPLWSLAYEIWFYILAGAIGLLLSGEGTLRAFIVLMICISVFAKLEAHYVLIWAMGAFSVLIMKSPGATRLALPGVLIIICGMLFYQLGSGSKSFAALNMVPPAVAEVMICSGFCMCLPWLINLEVNKKIVKLRRFAHYFSSISFSLYLIHYPINALSAKVFVKSTELSTASTELFIVKCFTCILLAIVFWMLFERSSFKLRHKLKNSTFMLKLENA